jgi:hypothetical protein
MSETKKYDTVEILRFKCEGVLVKEQWIPAVVVWSDEYNISVRALKGQPFDEAGHDLLSLPRSGHGRMWRR